MVEPETKPEEAENKPAEESAETEGGEAAVEKKAEEFEKAEE